MFIILDEEIWTGGWIYVHADIWSCVIGSSVENAFMCWVAAYDKTFSLLTAFKVVFSSWHCNNIHFVVIILTTMIMKWWPKVSFIRKCWRFDCGDRRAEVHVHGVFPSIHRGRQPQEAHARTHWWTTVCVWDLWQKVCTVGSLEEAPTQPQRWEPDRWNEWNESAVI